MIRKILSHDDAIDIDSKRTLWSVFLVSLLLILPPVLAQANQRRGIE